MLSAVLFLLFFVVILVKLEVFNELKKIKKLLEFSLKVPGPRFTEILWKNGKIDYLKWTTECHRKYGKRFVAWFGENPTLFLNTPDDIKEVLTHPKLFEKTKLYELIKVWFGESILNSSKEKWLKTRKLLNPTFSFHILKQYQTSMQRCSEILVKKLLEVADEKPVDIYQYASLYAFDVICETAMGVQMNVQEDQNSEYVEAVRTICKVLYIRTCSVFLKIPFIFNFSKYRKLQDDALRVLHGFLDMLLIAQRDNGDLTDEQIRGEVDTFIFGGHDTTSSALSFIIYELSRNPEIQEQVHKEVSEIGFNIDTCKYLEAVIKETLRLYPPVSFYARRSTEDTTIGDLVVPPGVIITANAYSLHHNPDIYPDPNKFNPDRFYNTSNIPNYAFIPFSAGPRNCIGHKFAMIELKITVANILRQFQFLPVPNYEPSLTTDIVVKSGNGIQVRIRKRS
ncbi:Probable cytochrome P450 4s3 [Sergentomyia squamirostris]